MKKPRKTRAARQAEAALLKRATGYKLREEKTSVELGEKGASREKTEVVLKEIGPDLEAIRWILKTSDPERWDGGSGAKGEPVINVLSGIPRPEPEPEAE